MAAQDFNIIDEGEEERRPKGRMAPDNLPTSYLVSAGYDGAEHIRRACGSPWRRLECVRFALRGENSRIKEDDR
jgi:hypothetical protein